MTNAEFFNQIESTFNNCLAIAKSKNHDYGSTEDPFANFRLCEKMAGVSLERGILVRLSDKLSRINTLLDGNKEAKVDEKLEDTIQDAINYLAILKAWLVEKNSTPQKVTFYTGNGGTGAAAIAGTRVSDEDIEFVFNK